MQIFFAIFVPPQYLSHHRPGATGAEVTLETWKIQKEKNNDVIKAVICMLHYQAEQIATTCGNIRVELIVKITSESNFKEFSEFVQVRKKIETSINGFSKAWIRFSYLLAPNLKIIASRRGWRGAKTAINALWVSFIKFP